MLIIGFYVKELTLFFVHKQAEEQAKYWYEKAAQDIGTGSSIHNAHDWFVNNNFEIMEWDRDSEDRWIGWNIVETKTEKNYYYIVQGSKVLYKDFWLDLCFKFDLEYNFHSIKYNLRTWPIPEWCNSPAINRALK